MALNARWTKGSIVSFQEHHTDDVVADVPFTLQLLWIVSFVRELGAYVKHDFNVSPVSVNRVQSR
jgi:hypothetical protein